MLSLRTTDSLFDVCTSALEAMATTWSVPKEELLNKFHTELVGNGKQAWGVAFTRFAVVFFSAVVRQLSTKATVYAAFRGKSDYLKSLSQHAEIFLNGTGGTCSYTPNEYLVDYYACAGLEKLVPLVTMESESTLLTSVDSKDTSVSAMAKLHDIDKLLSVSSPRRIYVGKAKIGAVDGFLEAVAERLNQAYRSQVLARGDHFVLMVFVESKVGSTKSHRVEIREFDSLLRMVAR